MICTKMFEMILLYLSNDIIIFAFLYLTEFGDRVHMSLFIGELGIFNHSERKESSLLVIDFRVLVLYIRLVQV